MLIRFRVQNHRSLRSEQELSFVAARLTEFPGNLVRVPLLEVDLLRVVGIYGANASGKSTVMSALKFMRDAVLNSHRQWKPNDPIPRQPFLLNPEDSKLPSLFELDFILSNVRYTYGFIIDSESVIEEWLHSYPQGKKQKWFTRNTHASKEFSFSRLMSGENKAVQSLTRPNSLFLSTAAQNNHLKLTPIFEYFDDALLFVDAETRDSRRHLTAIECVSPAFRESIARILTSADLGITGIEVEEQRVPERFWDMATRLFAGEPDAMERFQGFVKNMRQPLLLHKSVGGSDVKLPFSDESHGTQALFALAGDIVRTLATGGILCIDELDASLHPLMSIEIVKMFNDPASNPANSQLLFNTHDTNILEFGGLRRDQIWFTEKDSSGATHLYSLVEYKARKQENIRRGYLQGRYGAVPFVHTPSPLFIDEEDGQDQHS